MARPKTIEELAAEFEPVLRKAFLDAVARLRSEINVAEVVRRIERGDIDGALSALHLDADAFDGIAQALREAYTAGGNSAVAAMPRLTDPAGARVPVRFGGYNPEAARQVQEHSSRLITEIVDDQRQSIRAALDEGYRAGQNPRTTARQIVGPIGSAGRRDGGLIGLYGGIDPDSGEPTGQIAWVQSARGEVTSGDVSNYFNRKARDARFDPFLRDVQERGWDEALAAWNKRNGKADTKEQMVDRIVGRYSDRLLKVRGDTIARTESLWAMRSAQYEGIRQQIDAGKLDAEAVQLEWDATGDKRTRDSHKELDGVKVPFGQPFVSPLTGARMMFPGDTSLGAPGSETIQCRCVLKPVIDRYMGLT